jgi:hypothetical protein
MREIDLDWNIGRLYLSAMVYDWGHWGLGVNVYIELVNPSLGVRIGPLYMTIAWAGRGM